MSSETNTTERKPWSVARYNSNNAWLYNRDNGRLNNNNLYNDLTARPLDYGANESGLSFETFLEEMYGTYLITRRTKRAKDSQMRFEMNLTMNLMNLAVSVWNREYIQGESICFMLEKPKLREVIAAWFGDRVTQTWYCKKLEPFLEAEFYDPNSYSCRIGKGNLRAVTDLLELIRKETCDYVLDDVWVWKEDIKSCFMTVDTKMLEDRMVDYIWSVICEDEWLRDTLCWLTRIIYQSLPQEHCIIKTHPLAWENFPEAKSQFGKTIGIAIGNRANQQAVLFLTTFIIRIVRSYGYDPRLYTDDMAGVTKDKTQWKRDRKEIAAKIQDELHWQWHPGKSYLQNAAKGVPYLGFKIKRGYLLPSDRVAHNYLWKIKCFVRKSEENMRYVYREKEHVMQVVNSYIGIFKWCSANRLKHKGLKMIEESGFARVFDFNNGDRITLKKNMTQRAYYKWLNSIRRKKQREIQDKMFKTTIKTDEK